MHLQLPTPHSSPSSETEKEFFVGPIACKRFLTSRQPTPDILPVLAPSLGKNSL